MAAVQMLAALFHIHSIALSRATVHRQAHTNTHVRTHSCTKSRVGRKGKNTVLLLQIVLKFQNREKTSKCRNTMSRTQANFLQREKTTGAKKIQSN